jgi:hypothetical protein
MSRRLIAMRVSAAALALTVLVALGAPALAQEPATGDADLAAVKAYVVDEATQMRQGTSALKQTAEQYYTLAQAANFDYNALWTAHQADLIPLLQGAKDQWVQADSHYELNEGLIAGVPSLSYFDTWIDAGPSAAEDATNALDWTLELPDGRKLAKPGNILQHVTEATIWGTSDDRVGLRVDLDGDGQVGLGDALPEANVFVAGARVLDDATDQMQKAVDGWTPTIDDAFAALQTMIPTINEYFEQWKVSHAVSGSASTEGYFVAKSRLFDVNGIYHGLDLTYEEIRPLVAGVNAPLDAQIDAAFSDLVKFVGDLLAKEQAGTKFTPEEADLFGSEAQGKADVLVGQVAQAAALLGIQA